MKKILYKVLRHWKEIANDNGIIIMTPLSSNIIDIAACCGNCKYWGNIYPADKEYKSCKLAKDMCCDTTGIFGCVRGGEFASKKDFLCKFWESK